MTDKWIQRPEGGGRPILVTMIGFARFFGRAASRIVIAVVAFYFMWRRGPERRASRVFLARVFGRPARLTEGYRHILCFSQVTLDRIFLLDQGLDRFEIETTGLEQVHELVAHGRGLLLFGAHFGSYEVTRALGLTRPDLRFRSVIDLGQAPAMSQLLNALSPELAATVIDSRQAGTGVALAIKDALDERALVAMLVDRVRPGGRSIEARFLGDTAAFPAAPWEIAVVLGTPVVLCFGTYLGGNRYHLHFEAVAERIQRERNGGRPLAEWVQHFADRLAARVQAAPYNWFNFYDFWAR